MTKKITPGRRSFLKAGVAIRNVILVTLMTLLMLSAQQTIAQINKQEKMINKTSLSPKGISAPKENFTGNAWVNRVVTPQDNLNTLVAKVTFEHNARTNWHKHPSGQVLIVTNGTGYYQEKGKTIQSIKTGDVIKCAPGVIHWHGASPFSEMSHIAIVPGNEGGAEWLKPVSEEEYNSYKAEKSNSKK